MSISRRDFMRKTAAGGVVVLGSTTLPFGCGNPVAPAPLVDAQVEDDPTDMTNYGTVRLSLVAIPDLSLAGGAVTVRLAPLMNPDRQRPFALPSPPELLVAHRGQAGMMDEYIAVNSACPHAQCPLGYSKDQDRIECPCHSSQFRATSASGACVGDVMHAPARQGVTAYSIALDPNDSKVVVVDLKAPCGSGLPQVVDGKMTLMVSMYPMLANVGGSLIGRASGATDPIAIVRVSPANDATAFSCIDAKCTHAGCTVTHCPDAGVCPTDMNKFWCACHGSQFALDGKVLTGPATVALKSYTHTFDGTTLTVTIA